MVTEAAEIASVPASAKEREQVCDNGNGNNNRSSSNNNKTIQMKSHTNFSETKSKMSNKTLLSYASLVRWMSLGTVVCIVRKWLHAKQTYKRKRKRRAKRTRDSER